jgi:hypothetical protein
MQAISAAPALRSANPRTWLVKLARFGHAVKGLVYLLIGVLALRASATGHGPKGEDGAAREIGRQPFGDVWLVLMAVGLASYALWRIVQAVADPERRGRGLKAIGVRIGRAGSGLVHAGVALSALQLAFDRGHEGHHHATRTWVGSLLQQPFGSAVLVAIGAGIIVAGLAELHKAATASFQQELETSRMSPGTWTWLRRFGRLGYAAHAVVLPVIGLFVIRAALEFNPQRVKDFGGALRTLQAEPNGQLLLTVVAVGLAAYGLYMLIAARYVRIRTP